jgi:hypothetical protein
MPNQERRQSGHTNVVSAPCDGSLAMPVHDWTRVSDGTFHDFHYSWVLEIKRAL